MSNEFDFSDLEIIEIPVTGPDKQKYLLIEADAEGAKRFKNAQSNVYVFNEDGKVVGVKNPADLEPFLVSLCLKTATDKKPVGLDVINKWPDRVVSKLFDKAKEISEIGKSKEAESVQAAFNHESAPISLDDLRTWAALLPEEPQYRTFKLLLVDLEQKAKNVS